MDEPELPLDFAAAPRDPPALPLSDLVRFETST